MMSYVDGTQALYACQAIFDLLYKKGVISQDEHETLMNSEIRDINQVIGEMDWKEGVWE